MSNPATGLNAMFEQAIIGIHFAPDWYSPDSVDFTFTQWLCFILFYLIHLYFVVICIILLLRLLMAMMTNTFRSVQESAQLEWRLLITRHVLRFELVGAALFPSTNPHHTVLLAGIQSPIDDKYYYHFHDLQTVKGEPKTIPMQLAQPSEQDPLFDEASPRLVKPSFPPFADLNGSRVGSYKSRASARHTDPPGEQSSDDRETVPLDVDDNDELDTPASVTSLQKLRREMVAMREEMTTLFIAQRDLIEYQGAQLRRQIHDGFAARRRGSAMSFLQDDEMCA